MYKIKRQKAFIKDISKLKFSDEHYTKFIIYLANLAQGEKLPIEARDHKLNGEFKNFREFHIRRDILVIYQIKDTYLILIRIGSHSELFE